MSQNGLSTLSHHGVMGMHWGVRKASSASSGSQPKATTRQKVALGASILTSLGIAHVLVTGEYGNRYYRNKVKTTTRTVKGKTKTTKTVIRKRLLNQKLANGMKQSLKDLKYDITKPPPIVIKLAKTAVKRIR